MSRLEAAGGVERWSDAAREEPELAASLAAGDDEQRRIRRELAGDASGPTAARRSSSASAGRGGSGSLKCLHAHVAFALARPGYELGERILDEIEPLWPDRCCSVPREPGRGRATGVGGRDPPARGYARRRARYRQLLELLELVLDELRKRVGQTYTLEELAAAYGESERGRARSSTERAAMPGWPRDLTTVLAAAFDAYQRGAIDYKP